ncbi:MAG: lipoprotein-releasing ABC transporter permease subunit [Rickettsiales bacterium]|nr:lipoprotein-releasing ABC transporter permease subunit [Rickettsiales bacterium]MCA0254614.1 lipoprotein-releasing ABC transporter permease subunit [Pseudomonadota bacterium]
MSNSLVSFISFRYFRAKKNEKFVSIISGISLAGISIGVMALIIVMSVMNGFHIELTSNIIGLNGDIAITPMNKIIENHQEVISKVQKNKFVTKVSPLIVGQALAIGDGSNSGVIIRGINISDLKNKGPILDNVLYGSFADYDGLNVIAIGAELARNLGANVGSKVKLVSPNLLPTAFGTMPRAKDFTVVAIFSSGLFDYDAATVLMTVPAAQVFLSMKEGINLIEIKIDNSELVANYSKTLQKELGYSMQVKSWMQDNQQFLSVLQVERTTMFVILTLIMIVAAFNIISSLFMLVKDKTTDIAILKTIGASTKQIMMIFILNGMMVGVVGTFLGVSFGVLFAKNIEAIRKFLENLSGIKIFDPAIYFLYSLPSVVRVTDVIMIASLALFLSLIATIYPSYRAAVLNPVEAMRYE